MTTNFEPEAVAIGRAIRGAVATAGLSLDEAAEKAGIAARTLSRRVNGELPTTFTEMVRLAYVCGVKVTDLVAAAERVLGQDAA